MSGMTGETAWVWFLRAHYDVGWGGREALGGRSLNKALERL